MAINRWQVAKTVAVEVRDLGLSDDEFMERVRQRCRQLEEEERQYECDIQFLATVDRELNE